MNQFDKILNSSDASDALLGEQIDKINESIGDFSIIPLTAKNSGINIISGGYTKMGKLIIVNVRFSIVDTSAKGVSVDLVSPGVPLPKVLSGDKSYIAATVVDIESDAPANCYGMVSKAGALVANVPQANHAYAISATYICE